MFYQCVKWILKNRISSVVSVPPKLAGSGVGSAGSATPPKSFDKSLKRDVLVRIPQAQIPSPSRAKRWMDNLGVAKTQKKNRVLQKHTSVERKVMGFATTDKLCLSWAVGVSAMGEWGASVSRPRARMVSLLD